MIEAGRSGQDGMTCPPQIGARCVNAFQTDSGWGKV